MNVERVVRVAARPLARKLVPPLDMRDLCQEGRIALWLRGDGKAPAEQVIIARNAMTDALRKARWVPRASYGCDGRLYMDEADSILSDLEESGEALDGFTVDCHAASLVAVRQFIANLHKVSGRRREVLDGLIAGLTHREIARRMGVQEFAVTYHMKALREFAARYLECSPS